jgi:LacI family transcriptional regulator
MVGQDGDHAVKRTGVTLKDVAAAAKVSRATAARALNSYGYVDDDTAGRVLKAADSLGYRANRIAQALRRGQLPLIGFVPGDIQNPFFARIAHDLEVKLHKEGYNLLIVSSEEEVEQEKELLLSLRSLSVRGYILAPTSASDNQHVVDLSADGAPIVLIDRVVKNSGAREGGARGDGQVSCRPARFQGRHCKLRGARAYTQGAGQSVPFDR